MDTGLKYCMQLVSLMLITVGMWAWYCSILHRTHTKVEENINYRASKVVSQTNTSEERRQDCSTGAGEDHDS